MSSAHLPKVWSVSKAGTVSKATDLHTATSLAKRIGGRVVKAV